MGFYLNNTTAPNAYQGQEAGYYSGGSLFARDSVRDTQIASVDLPSFKSGCGGIDLFTGGFSFVNSQQLVNAMQNIINNAVGYSFNLALESATPEIANVMKYMNTLSNDINRANINSCETAAGLVGTPGRKRMWRSNKFAKTLVPVTAYLQTGRQHVKAVAPAVI